MRYSIPLELLEQCYAYGIKCYPEEACGFLSGPVGQNTVDQLHPMDNLMSAFHEKDPEQFPRTNRDAYLMDPQAQYRLEKQLKQSGRSLRYIFHTHPDVGAYFSEKDQNDALWDGEPRHPHLDFLVCGVTQGKADGAIVACFDETQKNFMIHTLTESNP